MSTAEYGLAEIKAAVVPGEDIGKVGELIKKGLLYRFGGDKPGPVLVAHSDDQGFCSWCYYLFEVKSDTYL